MSRSFANDIKNIRQDYSKIMFDTFSLKNIDKLYEAYNIPSDEKIIAYIKSRVMFVPLSVSGIIITDKAIYKHPGVVNKSNNCLAFSRLCKYIIVQKHCSDAVKAINSEEEFTVFGKMLLGNNTAGTELKKFLKSLRNHLLNKYSWAKEQNDEEIKKFMLSIRNKMRYSKIQKISMSAIDSVIEDGLSTDEAVLLKAECLFRICNIQELNEFLEYVSANIGVESANLIKNNISNFFNTLKKDIQNVDLEIQKEYLREIYANITADENIEENMFLYLLPYVCIRLWDYTEYKNIKELFVQKYGNKELRSLEYFMGCYKNIHMKEVYENIKNNQMPDKESLSWSDSIGFTPLHYAIILKQNQIIDKLLKNKLYYQSFEEIIKNEDIDEEIKEIYNYNVLAAFLNSEKKEQICQIFSEKLRKLNWEIKKSQLKMINTKKNIFIYKNCRQATLHGNNENSKDIMSYEEAVELLKAEEERLQEQEREFKELQIRFSVTLKQELHIADETAQKIKHSSNGFQTFIRYIFSDSNFLHLAIYGINKQYTLYTYKNLSFIVSKEIKLNFNNNTSQNTYDQRKKSSRTTPKAKAHSGSWFSAQAHNSKNILKKEYHELSKKYHPDMNGELSDSKTFIEIVSEYKAILREMQ